MTKQQKITLSASRDIPFNKLMLSQSNVRHVKAGVSIEKLRRVSPRVRSRSRTQRDGIFEPVDPAATGLRRQFRCLRLITAGRAVKRSGETRDIETPGPVISDSAG